MVKDDPVKQGGGAARALLAYLRSPDYRPIPQRQLLHLLHVGPEERPAVRRLLQRLIDEGRVLQTRGGRMVAAPAKGTFCGILQLRGKSTAFVVPESGGEEIFVSPEELGRATAGDRVKVRVSGRDADGRLSGVLTAVLGRGPRRLLGLVVQQGKRSEVHRLDGTTEPPIQLPGSFRMGAAEFDVVEIEPLPRSATGEPQQGKVLRVVGHLDDRGIDTQVVAHKYGLPLEFPDGVIEAAEKLPEGISATEAAGRVRFDDPPPCTIDGATARDFDDAISVTEIDRGFRLHVHIADVAHFVRPGSRLDQEAQRRGTSVYFPDRVLPMFPEKLSNSLCSLVPGEDRLVQTAILEFTSKGKLRKAEFADGVIRSAGRLTYDQVAQVLEGRKTGHGVPRQLVPMLLAADRLREVLERRRHSQGSIDFDLPDPQILLDMEGAMTGITVVPRNPAHRLIEEFMLAANRAVARHLEQRERACLFRIHEAPDPAKLEVLSRFVKGLGLDLPLSKGAIEPASIQRLLDQAEDGPEYRVVGQLAVRSMQQARYSPENVGHFGLAAKSYCHFTSPIRRYPDLVVHRQLRAERHGKPDPTAGNPSSLQALGKTCSDLERNAEAAERELLHWKKLAFIKDRVGEEFEGVITGVARFGMFVQLVENLVEGLVRVELLGNEWFLFDEGRQRLTGSSSGTTYRLGQRVSVKVDRVDRILQRVDFSLSGAFADPRPAEFASTGKRDKERRTRPRRR